MTPTQLDNIVQNAPPELAGIIAAVRGTSRSALAKEQVIRMIRRKGANLHKGGLP